MTKATPSDVAFMKEALAEAEAALQRGDRPIGAVIVHEGCIIARGSNTYFSSQNDVGHAELNAILACASQLQQFHQAHSMATTIYTTCEPCLMCLGAIVMSNIQEIVYGMPDNYTRARVAIDAMPYVKKRVRRYVGGVLEDECVELFRRFSEEETAWCLEGRQV